MLRLHGYDEGGTAVLVAGERRRLTERSPRLVERLWGWVLAATVGYGHKPGRAILWLFALWLLGWGWFSMGSHYHTMLPDPKSETKAAVFGGLDAFFYSLDAMLPVIDLGVADAWHPSRNDLPLWVYWRVHVTLGWVFSTFAVLGFTGLIKKE